ncbi:hypothetical protein KBZ94_19200 [Streptomyces sp. RM72]|uniref:hypothetical protein n=1 Tax=unclassified Streptomyces TaxID=2593676 RepID=UPI001B374D65|nr:hypothetical protein [Streptomyces sp. RM72]MBQ0887039.1 hypothetical protein [Streptomyces sp. RM72]
MKTRSGVRRRAGVVATLMTGAAVLLGGATAQPAAAATAEIPWGQANFYTGYYTDGVFTGDVFPIPDTGTTTPSECINLPEPMRSIANFKYAWVEVYSGEDCTHIMGRITGLHGGTLPLPALSYKVLVSY